MTQENIINFCKEQNITFDIFVKVFEFLNKDFKHDKN